MNIRRIWMAAAFAVTVIAVATPVSAFDPEATFHKGTFVLSGAASYGWQFELEEKSDFSGLEFWTAAVRGGVLPFDTFASGTPVYGAFELGLEAIYLHYVEQDEYWAGLAAVIRYHFLSLGRFVPYVEIGGGAGGTNLEVPEIRSNFAFLIFGGVGASVFVADRTALYAGYRWQHVSNGNTSHPNRGYEANVAVAGFSLFF
jgi:hypothetical protein